jgi:hypothetical protein
VPRRIVFLEATDIPRTVTGKVKLVETASMIEAGVAPLAIPSPA